MLSEIGRIMIVACALPAYVKGRAGDLLRAEGEVFKLRGLYDHAMGMLDESRGETRRMTLKYEVCAASHTRLDDLATRLEDEVKLLTREAADLRTDVQRLTAMVSTSDRLDAQLRAELAAARAELEALRKPAVSPPAASAVVIGEGPCAWCLKEVHPVAWPRWVYADMVDVNLGKLPLCSACGEDEDVHGDDVRTRVATRAASCPSRRTSPDPLDAACTLGCGAPAGKPRGHEVSP